MRLQERVLFVTGAASGMGRAAVQAGIEKFGKINCLFNNAGICPGHIDTPLLKGSFIQRGAAEGKSVDEYYAEMEKTIPMGRLAQPEEIGELVAFLCDDRSAYINGNSILVTGGKVME